MEAQRPAIKLVFKGNSHNKWFVLWTLKETTDPSVDSRTMFPIHQSCFQKYLQRIRLLLGVGETPEQRSTPIPIGQQMLGSAPCLIGAKV